MKISKSDYDYSIIDGVICIDDLNRGNMSVTNDAENVITEIYLKSGIGESVKKYPIIYRDTERIWDQIVPVWAVKSCVDVNFIHLGETNVKDAIKRVKEKI